MIFQEQDYEKEWRYFDFVWDSTVKYTNKETWEIEIIERQKELVEWDWLTMEEVYITEKDIESV